MGDVHAERSQRRVSAVDGEPELTRRKRALAKTQAKYRDRPHDWKETDCIRMLRSHLVAMGHKGLPKVPNYSTAIGAKRALTKMGFESVAQLLDSLLPRIAPARAWLGDVILMGGLEGLDTVTLYVGGNKVAGWHEDGAGMVVVTPAAIEGAWRA